MKCPKCNSEDIEEFVREVNHPKYPISLRPFYKFRPTF